MECQFDGMKYELETAIRYASWFTTYGFLLLHIVQELGLSRSLVVLYSLLSIYVHVHIA